MIAARWWALGDAFAHPVVVILVLATASVLLLAPLVAVAGARANLISTALRREILVRTMSWAVIVPAIFVPVLIGPAWTILGVGLLGAACFSEYARATGLFRERVLCLLVLIGIILVTFAALDHWYGFFMALMPLTVIAIAVVTIPQDRPQHYVQRVALAVLGFLVFGAGLGHLGYMANDPGYRPIVLMIVCVVAFNDVLAFSIGKFVGGPKLLAHTSPNKTVSGALGALVVTTILVAIFAGTIFAGTGLERLGLRVVLGIIIAALAQLGDLMLSSIKRDIGIKDMGTLIPGHGGVLDRFDSLYFVLPVAAALYRLFGLL